MNTKLPPSSYSAVGNHSNQLYLYPIFGRFLITFHLYKYEKRVHYYPHYQNPYHSTTFNQIPHFHSKAIHY